MSNRDDEELAVLLADLERTLTDLRGAIDDDVRRRRRPPTPGELLRFTEEYTLPTLIALLEATVQSLELLRAALRLADPQSSTDRLRDRLASRERGPTDEALRATVADLRNALTGTDLPEDSAAAGVVTDARELTARIEKRLESMETESESDSVAEDTSDESRGVAIDVEEEGESGVDVDAELASIKESVETEDRDE